MSECRKQVEANLNILYNITSGITILQQSGQRLVVREVGENQIVFSLGLHSKVKFIFERVTELAIKVAVGDEVVSYRFPSHIVFKGKYTNICIMQDCKMTSDDKEVGILSAVHCDS